MRIRRLDVTDMPRAMATFRSAVAATQGHPYSAEQVATWLSGMTEERLRSALADTEAVGAYDGHEAGGGEGGRGGDLLGFANLVHRGGATGELDLLYVEPAAAGRGIGSGLVAEIERLAVQAGITELRVDASCRAAPMLEHLGYEVERRYEKQVGGVTFPNTWLRRALTSAPTA